LTENGTSTGPHKIQATAKLAPKHRSTKDGEHAIEDWSLEALTKDLAHECRLAKGVLERCNDRNIEAPDSDISVDLCSAREANPEASRCHGSRRTYPKAAFGSVSPSPVPCPKPFVEDNGIVENGRGASNVELRAMLPSHAPPGALEEVFSTPCDLGGLSAQIREIAGRWAVLTPLARERVLAREAFQSAGLIPNALHTRLFAAFAKLQPSVEISTPYLGWRELLEALAVLGFRIGCPNEAVLVPSEEGHQSLEARKASQGLCIMSRAEDFQELQRTALCNRADENARRLSFVLHQQSIHPECVRYVDFCKIVDALES
jgi:hypothetical protein